MKSFKTTLASGLAILTIGLCRSVVAANLFLNGNFEAGNTGFGSDLTYSTSPPLTDGHYSMANNPSVWWPFSPDTWQSMGDHTTGSGLMQLATPNPGTSRVWYETTSVRILLEEKQLVRKFGGYILGTRSLKQFW